MRTRVTIGEYVRPLVREEYVKNAIYTRRISNVFLNLFYTFIQKRRIHTFFFSEKYSENEPLFKRFDNVLNP